MRIRPTPAPFFCSLIAFSCQWCVLTGDGFADLLVGAPFANAVWRIDEQDGSSVLGGIAPSSAGLEFPSGVTVGPDGNIYVSSLNTGEVLFYDGDTGLPLPSPHAGERQGLFATLRTSTTPMSAPGPLQFGPDGNLYVSDFGGTEVWSFHGTTGMHLDFVHAVLNGPPAGLTFASDGDLYVGDFGSASVQRVENGIASFFILPQTGGLLTPSSLLFLPDGDLLIVDLFGNQILRFDENGQNPSVFAVIPPPIPDPPPPGVDPSNNPSGIAFDSDGNIVVAVLGLTNPPDNRGALLRYDLQGNLLETVLDMQTPFGSVARIEPSDFLFGDYDGNGMIQTADYTKWRADFGKAVAAGSGADGNGNGGVDAADYAVWRKTSSGGAASGSAVVPEPGAMGLVLWGVLFMAAARGRSFRFASRR